MVASKASAWTLTKMIVIQKSRFRAHSKVAVNLLPLIFDSSVLILPANRCFEWYDNVALRQLAIPTRTTFLCKRFARRLPHILATLA